MWNDCYILSTIIRISTAWTEYMLGIKEKSFEILKYLKPMFVIRRMIHLSSGITNLTNFHPCIFLIALMVISCPIYSTLMNDFTAY